MRYWFSSDLHLNHDNIRRYCNRPFDNIEHMNCVLMTNWNKRVSPEDLIFHVGDFCFKNSPGGKKGEGRPVKASDLEQQLNGKIIHVLGNHDRQNSVRTIVKSMVIKYGPHYINIVHNPTNFDPRYKINFVGHIHNLWKFKREFNLIDDTYTDLINVGVDVNDFMPKTFEELYRDYKRWDKRTSKDWRKHPEVVKRVEGKI